MTDEPVVINYLDGYTDKHGKTYKKGTPNEIRKRIIEKKTDCKLYGLLHNNCEHLATYVRYGVKIALQFNLTGEGKCFNKNVDVKHMLAAMREASCNIDSSS
ncbi:uncharacterized protein AKAME5_002365700 [Lates japonicus]|uniref:LRAT domain-containing protein n=1 Tax=Lates japonicus TaxID=270547 RepID=A0AAD3RKD1_LATJO|nr:uncharacterized protein AKAME5_002365700 [Lates japonicus]